MTVLEADAQTSQAFKSSVEDLALEELSRLTDEATKLRAAQHNIQEEIKAVKAILRASTGKSNPGTKPGTKKKQSPFSMSDERIEAFETWIRTTDGEITSRAVRAAFPNWSDSYCNSALKEFRERGILRLSATSGGMNIYRSLL